MKVSGVRCFATGAATAVVTGRAVAAWRHVRRMCRDGLLAANIDAHIDITVRFSSRICEGRVGGGPE